MSFSVIRRSGMDIGIAEPPYRRPGLDQHTDRIEADMGASRIAFHMDLDRFLAGMDSTHAETTRRGEPGDRREYSPSRRAHFATSCSCDFGTCHRMM